MRFVVAVDTDWNGFLRVPGEPSPAGGRELRPSNEEQTLRNIEGLAARMKQWVGGEAVFTVHTSLLFRDIAFREPYVSLWRSVVADGGELSLHPHEDTGASGTLYPDTAHMSRIIREKSAELVRLGLPATSFRGGYFAYSPAVTAILADVGLLVDLTSAPGLVRPERDAFWAGAPLSAHLLCMEDPTHGECAHPRSSVLEIPLGNDGKGADFRTNFLFNERATGLPELKRVWDAIVERCDQPGRVQFVQFLCHSYAMDSPELADRCQAFLEYAQANGGRPAVPSVARELYWRSARRVSP